MKILNFERQAAPVRVSIGANFLIPIIFLKGDLAKIVEGDLIAGVDWCIEKVACAEKKNSP